MEDCEDVVNTEYEFLGSSRNSEFCDKIDNAYISSVGFICGSVYVAGLMSRVPELDFFDFLNYGNAMSIRAGIAMYVGVGLINMFRKE